MKSIEFYGFSAALKEDFSASEIRFLYRIFEEFFGRKKPEISFENYIENAAKELLTGKPYQQVLGETEFYGLLFTVNEHVLIPRPETEELLEIAIREIKKRFTTKQKFKILDIGTGSGIIPIVLKKNFTESDIISIDFSEDALKTAKQNADLHQMEITFLHQNYLESKLSDEFDIVISNPPYIGIDEKCEIEDSVKIFEPEMALFSPTSDPLIFYRKIASDSQAHLSENGLIFLEINQKLGSETLELFKNFNRKELIKDLSGNDRFIIVGK